MHLAVWVLVVLVQSALIAALLWQRAGRARAERALRADAERFRLIAERVPVMIWTTTHDTTLDYLNSYCVQFTGLPLAELKGHGWLQAVHPDDYDHCVNTYTPAVEHRVPFRVEYRIRGANGDYRWFMDSGVPTFATDGTYTGYVGCTVDISDRKESEQAIRKNEAMLHATNQQIRDLAGRLIAAQEVERARIARELHDGLSQDLAGLSIALSRLKRRVEAPHTDGDLPNTVTALQDRTIAIAETVRHLSHHLHPSVLDHAGLVAALSAHCAELRLQRDIAVSFTAEGDLASIDRDTALCLYRITQEALRNVATHAHARRASVTLRGHIEGLELTITDDGKGFNITATREGHRGLGLVSMTERVRLAGGTVSVITEVDRGTTIRVHLARVPDDIAMLSYVSA